MLGAGARMPAGLEIREPQFAYRKNEKKNPRAGEPAWLPLRLRAERSLWRDSTALLAASTQQHRPPLARDWLAQLVAHGKLGRVARYRITVSGLVSDRAKVFAWRQERIPVPAAYLGDQDLVEVLRGSISASEAVDWTVRQALLSATQPRRGEGRTEKEPTIAVGQRRYWSLLEVPFWQFLEDLPRDQEGAPGRWAVHLRRAAMEAFDHAVSGLHEGRLIREVTLARAQLQRRLRAQLRHLEEVDDEGGQEGAVRGAPRAIEGR
jgi:CRISPR type I-E-associated protein CasA/Cse1